MTMDPSRAFGKALRLLRDEQGLSQEKLASLAHLHRTHISLLERGRRQPTLTTVFRLASVLGVSATEFIQAVEEEIDASGPN